MPKEFDLKKSKETLARLSAPAHIVKSHFLEHARVEGYLQDLERENFLGSDRLMKYDTMFGRVQLGYDPQKENTFLFVNIKPSIYDTVASQYQRELNEDNMYNTLKTESENVVYSSKRRSNAASILYKKDAKPWSEGTLRPHIIKKNLESFAKVMPFLQSYKDKEERAKLVEEDRRLKAQAYELSHSGNTKHLVTTRKNQYVHLKQLETINSIINRKESASSMFFRKVNFSFDYQKREIFAYYKKVKEQSLESANEALEAPADDNKDE